METLKKAIDEKRNIKPNSLNAYVISISKLHRATEGDGEFKNLDFLPDRGATRWPWPPPILDRFQKLKS